MSSSTANLVVDRLFCHDQAGVLSLQLECKHLTAEVTLYCFDEIVTGRLHGSLHIARNGKTRIKFCQT